MPQGLYIYIYHPTDQTWNGTSTRTTHASLFYGQVRFFTAPALRPSFSYSYTPETRATFVEMPIRARRSSETSRTS